MTAMPSSVGPPRVRAAANAWAATEAQWQWVLEDPDRYMMYSRQVKYFLNQF
jgi:hypothetical protein